MDIVKVCTEVEAVVNQELECINKLLPIFKEEHDAIKLSNTDKLHQTIEAKKPLIMQLQVLDQQRGHVLTCNGITPTQKAFNQIIGEVNSASLNAAWTTLKVKLAECKKSNELNGRLIHMRKNNNDGILKILLGNRQTSSETYSSAGKTGLYSRSGLSAVV